MVEYKPSTWFKKLRLEKIQEKYPYAEHIKETDIGYTIMKNKHKIFLNPYDDVLKKLYRIGEKSIQIGPIFINRKI